MHTVKIGLVKSNPDNPRLIKVPNYNGYYCNEDGQLFSDRSGVMKEIYGSLDKNGYLKITLVNDDGKFIYLRKHRIIIEAFSGASELQVNHKDSNKINNALNNLEYVTGMENQCHRRLNEGYSVGVCWDKKSKKWRAYIQNNKKWEHLGFYTKKEDAKDAYILRLKELKIINRYAEQN